MYKNRQFPGLFALFIGLCLSTQLMAADIKQWTQRAETGDSQRVLQELDPYLKNHPDDYPAMFLQARLLTKQGDMQAAIKTYQRLIKQQPSQPEAYNNLAAIFASQGDYEQAQHLLEQAMQTHPSYAAVYENLSHLYVEKARSSYGKALQLDAAKNTISLQELKSVPESTPVVPTQVAKIESPPTAAIPTANNTPPVKQEVVPAPPAASSLIDQPPLAVDEQAIITTLQGWAAAWSEQAADVYLIFYADDYAPEGMTRTGWEQERRERLKKPDWINIALSDFKVEPLADGEAKVLMIQDYRASNYQDKTRKLIRMRDTPDGWRIVAEQSIAKLE